MLTHKLGLVWFGLGLGTVSSCVVYYGTDIYIGGAMWNNVDMIFLNEWRGYRHVISQPIFGAGYGCLT